MGRKLYYVVVSTAAGWVGLLGSEDGLQRVTLPQGSPEGVLTRLDVSHGEAVSAPEFFTDLTERLRAYFAGQRVDFPDKLDLSGATSFQRAVWLAARLINYGETRTYAWVAQQIKQPVAVRAVGQALGRNPLPVIIPCHRVMASGGGLGGFSGGVAMKRSLLLLESR